MRLAKFLAAALGMARLLAMMPSRATLAVFTHVWTENHLFAWLSVACRARSKSVRCFKRRQDDRVWSALGGKANAAFGPSRGDNRPAPLGFHAHQKSVSALPFGNRGLVCAFHLATFLVVWFSKTRNYNIYRVICQAYFSSVDNFSPYM